MIGATVWEKTPIKSNGKKLRSAEQATINKKAELNEHQECLRNQINPGVLCFGASHGD